MNNAQMPTIKKAFGPTIAERRLVADDPGIGAVIVSLGTPRHNGSEEWECPFRIKGRGLKIVEFGRGVDAMQALTTALDGIRYFLDQTNLALSWENGIPNHTGFQRSITIALGATFAKRLERLVDREIARHVRTLQTHGKRRAVKRKG